MAFFCPILTVMNPTTRQRLAGRSSLTTGARSTPERSDSLPIPISEDAARSLQKSDQEDFSYYRAEVYATRWGQEKGREEEGLQVISTAQVNLHQAISDI